MPGYLQIRMATEFSIEQLAGIFTRAFEGYFYPGITTPETLAMRIRVEAIDLMRSPVLLVDDEPAGIALLSVRSDQAWCGGFGITVPFRGRGLAHTLAHDLVEQARLARCRILGLEVLTRNTPAIKAYERVGFRTWRDLLILEWKRPAEWNPGPADLLVAAEPAMLLNHFAALHPVPPAWQRNLAALLSRGPLEGLALVEGGETLAYVLLGQASTETLRLADLGARRPEDATRLLLALQACASQILGVNEPSDSPLTQAFLATGFVEIDRQHEMAIQVPEGK